MISISKLHCHHCGIEISGDFVLTKLYKLTKEQINFVLVFLKNQGNIKAIEKELNISYPTVKKMLNDVLISLGYDVSDDDMVKQSQSNQRQDILDKLARKEISFEEASSLLKSVK